MTQRVTAVLAAALAAVALVSAARAETPEEEIRRAFTLLADDDAKKREAGESLLREIGPEVIAHYDRGREGRDPEVAFRIRTLLEEWKVRPCAAMTGGQSYVRLASWESPDDVPRDWWQYVDDDRLRDWMRARAGDHLQCLIYCLQLPEIPLEESTVRAALALNERESLAALARRPDLERHAGLLRPARDAALRLAPGNGSEAANVVLWRLGERDHLLLAIRERRVQPNVALLFSQPLDAEACDAIADVFGDQENLRKFLGETYPSSAWLDQYVRDERADLAARLRPDDARKALESIRSGSPKARFQASVWLAAMGGEAAGTEAFDSIPIDDVGFLPAGFPSIAPRIPGERVEIRLRRLIENPGIDELSRERALCALAARGRKQDITFIYTQLESIHYESAPPVAIALARLGSAAGVGVLLPHLSSPDPRVRFPSAAALRTIIGGDFDYDPAGSLTARSRAARKWAAWWRKNRTSFHPDVK